MRSMKLIWRGKNTVRLHFPPCHQAHWSLRMSTRCIDRDWHKHRYTDGYCSHCREVTRPPRCVQDTRAQRGITIPTSQAGGAKSEEPSAIDAGGERVASSPIQSALVTYLHTTLHGENCSNYQTVCETIQKLAYLCMTRTTFKHHFISTGNVDIKNF